MMQMDPNMVDMNGQPIMQPMVGPDGQPIMMDGNQMAYTQEQIDVSLLPFSVSITSEIETETLICNRVETLYLRASELTVMYTYRR